MHFYFKFSFTGSCRSGLPIESPTCEQNENNIQNVSKINLGIKFYLLTECDNFQESLLIPWHWSPIQFSCGGICLHGSAFSERTAVRRYIPPLHPDAGFILIFLPALRICQNVTSRGIKFFGHAKDVLIKAGLPNASAES